MSDNANNMSGATALASDIIKLGGYYDVADAPSFKILKHDVDPDKQTPITLTTTTTDPDGAQRTENRPLALVGSKDKDVIIVNPFSSGESTGGGDDWFMYSIVANVSKTLCTLIATTVKLALDEKKNAEEKAKKGKSKKKKDADAENVKHPVTELTTHISKVIDLVNNKTLSEIGNVLRAEENFFVVYYDRKSGCSKVRCSVFNETFRSDFTANQVRAETWKVITTLILSFLGIDDIKNLRYKPFSKKFPIIESKISMCVDIYRRLKPTIEAFGLDLCGDIDHIVLELMNIDEYGSAVRWCIDTRSILVDEDVVVKSAKAKTIISPPSRGGQSVVMAPTTNVFVPKLGAPQPSVTPPMYGGQSIPTGNGYQSFNPVRLPPRCMMPSQPVQTVVAQPVMNMNGRAGSLPW